MKLWKRASVKKAHVCHESSWNSGEIWGRKLSVSRVTKPKLWECHCVLAFNWQSITIQFWLHFLRPHSPHLYGILFLPSRQGVQNTSDAKYFCLAAFMSVFQKMSLFKFWDLIMLYNISFYLSMAKWAIQSHVL